MRFADADLVRIELDGESLGQAGLIEDGPVGSAGVGVGHDAHGHAELGGGVEEFDETGAQGVLGAAGGQFALEFAGMTDEDLAFGGRKRRSVEVAPDGAVVELGRLQQPRLAVLPIAQSDPACREDGRELVRAAVMSGPGQQLRGDPGDLEAGLGSLMSGEDDSAEVEQQRLGAQGRRRVIVPGGSGAAGRDQEGFCSRHS